MSGPSAPETYGWDRARWGPYWRQVISFIGRTLERAGIWLDNRSWGF